MDAVSNDSLGDFISQAKQAEIQGDYPAARKALDAALWKAEQYSLASGKLEETLKIAAKFYSNRCMDDQAVPLWEKLVRTQAKLIGTDDIRLIPALDEMLRCFDRAQNYRRIEQILGEIIRIQEASQSSVEERSIRLERLAKHYELIGNVNEAQSIRTRIRGLSGPSAAAAPAAAPNPKTKPTEEVPLQRKIFIGHMLTRSGLVSFDKLNQGLADAKMLELPIGEVLVSNGHISAEELQAALDLQGMVKANQISFDQAANILAVIRSKKVNMQEALAEIKGESTTPKTQLGSMLVASNWVTEEQLTEILAKCKETGFPIGKQLVLSRVVPAAVVAQVLNVQEQVRTNQINSDEGIALLKKLRASV